MINFSDEEAYKSYFQALATSHVDIDFFFFGDEDNHIDVQRTKGTSEDGITMWLDHYPPIQAGERDSNTGTIKAEFTIMKNGSRNNNDEADLQAIRKECEDITQQVLAKIMKDHNDAIGPSNEPLIESAVFGPMQSHVISGNRYEGTLCQVDFTVPLKFDYDETKWE